MPMNRRQTVRRPMVGFRLPSSDSEEDDKGALDDKNLNPKMTDKNLSNGPDENLLKVPATKSAIATNSNTNAAANSNSGNTNADESDSSSGPSTTTALDTRRFSCFGPAKRGTVHEFMLARAMKLYTMTNEDGITNEVQDAEPNRMHSLPAATRILTDHLLRAKNRLEKQLTKRGVLPDDPRMKPVHANFSEAKLAETIKRKLQREVEEQQMRVNDADAKNGDRPPDSSEVGAVEHTEPLIETSRVDSLKQSIFVGCIARKLDLIEKTLEGALVISDFPAFEDKVRGICDGVWDEHSDTGSVPPLRFGMSFCTIDGQRGRFPKSFESVARVQNSDENSANSVDADQDDPRLASRTHFESDPSTSEFPMQSCAKPLLYAFALDKYGDECVHSFVGREPSGSDFNALLLSKAGLPHNPMINSGAISLCGMLGLKQFAKRKGEGGPDGKKKKMRGSKVVFEVDNTTNSLGSDGSNGSNKSNGSIKKFDERSKSDIKTIEGPALTHSNAQGNPRTSEILTKSCLKSALKKANSSGTGPKLPKFNRKTASERFEDFYKTCCLMAGIDREAEGVAAQSNVNEGAHKTNSKNSNTVTPNTNALSLGTDHHQHQQAAFLHKPILGYCQSTFLKEKAHGHRNQALAHFLNENQAFPPELFSWDCVSSEGAAKQKAKDKAKAVKVNQNVKQKVNQMKSEGAVEEEGPLNKQKISEQRARFGAVEFVGDGDEGKGGHNDSDSNTTKFTNATSGDAPPPKPRRSCHPTLLTSMNNADNQSTWNPSKRKKNKVPFQEMDVEEASIVINKEEKCDGALSLQSQKEFTPKKAPSDETYSFRHLVNTSDLPPLRGALAAMEGENESLSTGCGRIEQQQGKYLGLQQQDSADSTTTAPLQKPGKRASSSILPDILDFYFQTCSVTCNTASLSVMAATLANAGVCPLNGERIFSEDAVAKTLSMMYACGMAGYSGEFAFKIGLPAKAGNSGGLLIVVPGVMGVATFSPELDKFGNSIAGVEFCRRFSAECGFHNFVPHDRNTTDVGNLKKRKSLKIDNNDRTSIHRRRLNSIVPVLPTPLPGRRQHNEDFEANFPDESLPTEVRFAAATGDIDSLKRLRFAWPDEAVYRIIGAHNDIVDHNDIIDHHLFGLGPSEERRTPLHLCCSNGHLECVKFLVHVAEGYARGIVAQVASNKRFITPLQDARRSILQTLLSPLDRHFVTPLQDAELEKQQGVVRYLRGYLEGLEGLEGPVLQEGLEGLEEEELDEVTQVEDKYKSLHLEPLDVNESHSGTFSSKLHANNSDCNFRAIPVPVVVSPSSDSVISNSSNSFQILQNQSEIQDINNESESVTTDVIDTVNDCDVNGVFHDDMNSAVMTEEFQDDLRVAEEIKRMVEERRRDSVQSNESNESSATVDSRATVDSDASETEAMRLRRAVRRAERRLF